MIEVGKSLMNAGCALIVGGLVLTVLVTIVLGVAFLFFM